jgi:hypothetical protein
MGAVLASETTQCTHTDFLVCIINVFSLCCTTDATGWVKKVSELEYAKQGGAGKEPAVSAPAMSKRPRWEPKNMGLFTHDQETGDDETVASTAMEAPTSARATRIGLVSTVVALSAYNVHLYFSK